jgi:hypothetical protein
MAKSVTGVRCTMSAKRTHGDQEARTYVNGGSGLGSTACSEAGRHCPAFCAYGTTSYGSIISLSS